MEITIPGRGKMCRHGDKSVSCRPHCTMETLCYSIFCLACCRLPDLPSPILIATQQEGKIDVLDFILIPLGNITFVTQTLKC